jgi:hypothetical protein
MAEPAPPATMESPVRAALRRLRPRVRRPGLASRELFFNERESAGRRSTRIENIARGLCGSTGSTRIEVPILRSFYPRESAQSVSSAFYSENCPDDEIQMFQQDSDREPR